MMNYLALSISVVVINDPFVFFDKGNLIYHY